MPCSSFELVGVDGTAYVADPAGVWDAPDGFTPAIDDPDDWDRSGVFYDDEPHPEGSIPLYRLTPEPTSASLDLLGVADIARRIGVSRPRVWQLRRWPEFPQPIGRYGDRDLWREITIRHWAAANGRRYIELSAPEPKPFRVPATHTDATATDRTAAR